MHIRDITRDEKLQRFLKQLTIPHKPKIMKTEFMLLITRKLLYIKKTYDYFTTKFIYLY